MSATCFMVAEKPSIAEAIAKALAGGRFQTKPGPTKVHTWNGRFKGRNAYFKCCGVTGHVFDIDFEYKYRNWSNTDPIDLFDAPTTRKPAGGGKMVRHLQNQSYNIDYLILWLDCDREGENICFEVMDVVRRNMRRTQGQSVYRAHFSAITPGAIQKAFATLGRPNKNWSDAVEARKDLDLKIGVAFTRFQTKFFTEKYGQINQRSLVSYGPCQTPTLGFVVKRHDERMWFTQEQYWTLGVSIQNKNWDNPLPLRWSRGRIFDRPTVDMFYNSLTSYKTAKVISVTSSKERVPRPKPLNTVQMLQSASKGLRIGPRDAMHIAERLYLRGFISYPRTETEAYPKGFDLKGTLRAQTRDPEWGQFAKELLDNGYTQPRRGHDAGDHPPITPVAYASKEQLKSDEFKIYNFIVRHFIATLSPDCELDVQTAEFIIGEEKFSQSGSQIINQGFLEVANWRKVDEHSFPSMKKGQNIPITNLKVDTGKTQPPPFLTEADLIALMEKHGIGTDASIPQHIANVVEREYVKVDGGTRELRPTPLGLLLGHGYHKIDPDLVLPELRAYMESNMTSIADGKARKDAIVYECLQIFKAKFKYFIAKFDKMDDMFDQFYNNPKTYKGGKRLSLCGFCRRSMKLIKKGGPPKLYCDQCDQVYRLPMGLEFKQTQQLCPISNFEVIKYAQPNKTNPELLTSFPIDPYNYNWPPTKYPDPERPTKTKKKRNKNKKKSNTNTNANNNDNNNNNYDNPNNGANVVNNASNGGNYGNSNNNNNNNNYGGGHNNNSNGPNFDYAARYDDSDNDTDSDNNNNHGGYGRGRGMSRARQPSRPGFYAPKPLPLPLPMRNNNNNDGYGTDTPSSQGANDNYSSPYSRAPYAGPQTAKVDPSGPNMNMSYNNGNNNNNNNNGAMDNTTSVHGTNNNNNNQPSGRMTGPSFDPNRNINNINNGGMHMNDMDQDDDNDNDRITSAIDDMKEEERLERIQWKKQRDPWHYAKQYETKVKDRRYDKRKHPRNYYYWGLIRYIVWIVIVLGGAITLWVQGAACSYHIDDFAKLTDKSAETFDDGIKFISGNITVPIAAAKYAFQFVAAYDGFITDIVDDYNSLPLVPNVNDPTVYIEDIANYLDHIDEHMTYFINLADAYVNWKYDKSDVEEYRFWNIYVYLIFILPIFLLVYCWRMYHFVEPYVPQFQENGLESIHPRVAKCFDRIRSCDKSTCSLFLILMLLVLWLDASIDFGASIIVSDICDDPQHMINQGFAQVEISIYDFGRFYNTINTTQVTLDIFDTIDYYINCNHSEPVCRSYRPPVCPNYEDDCHFMDSVFNLRCWFQSTNGAFIRIRDNLDDIESSIEDLDGYLLDLIPEVDEALQFLDEAQEGFKRVHQEFIQLLNRFFWVTDYMRCDSDSFTLYQDYLKARYIMCDKFINDYVIWYIIKFILVIVITIIWIFEVSDYYIFKWCRIVCCPCWCQKTCCDYGVSIERIDKKRVEADLAAQEKQAKIDAINPNTRTFGDGEDDSDDSDVGDGNRRRNTSGNTGGNIGGIGADIGGIRADDMSGENGMNNVNDVKKNKENKRNDNDKGNNRLTITTTRMGQYGTDSIDISGDTTDDRVNGYAGQGGQNVYQMGNNIQMNEMNRQQYGGVNSNNVYNNGNGNGLSPNHRRISTVDAIEMELDSIKQLEKPNDRGDSFYMD